MLTFEGGFSVHIYSFKVDVNSKLFVGGAAGGGSAGFNNMLLPRASLSWRAGVGVHVDASVNRK